MNQNLQDMMQRILSLVEAQEARIQALERGNPTPSVDPREVAAQSWNPNRPSPSSDPVLASLQLPASFDVQFYEGSARLTLTAQLQLNEVMEYLGMYPQLRVVCTGHADLTGDRAANLALSKKRAQAVGTLAVGRTVSTLAGSGTKGFKDGAADEAQFSSPRGVAIAADGSVLVADSYNSRIRKISADGRNRHATRT